MRGQIVHCKEFTGEIIERVFWDQTEKLVFVHTPDQFEARKKGLPHLEAVGFPVEDVQVFHRQIGGGYRHQKERPSEEGQCMKLDGER